jgi:hypothetical protein
VRPDCATASCRRPSDVRRPHLGPAVRVGESTGTIDDARLDSFDNGQARVFVDATVATVTEGQPPHAPRQWRLIITVQKVSESYKTSTVEFQK